MKFSVVYRLNGKEVGRSEGMEFEKAIAIVRSNQDMTSERNSAYVEETRSVKHLPVVKR